MTSGGAVGGAVGGDLAGREAAGGALLVRGGEGGMTVSLAELEDLAALLRETARCLGLAETALRFASARLRAGAELAPAAGARALAAVEDALVHAAGVAADVDALADGALGARGVYERAEWSAMELVDRVLGARTSLLPVPRIDQVLRPFGWAMSLRADGWPRAELDVAGEAGRRAVAPSGAQDLIAGIDALYPAAGGEAGSLEVRRIEHSDGGTAWAVLIPGTQSLRFGTANPMDNETNLEEYVGAPSAMASAVLAALTAAGARRGEPVLLAGHSQGGLVAMRLAAQPAFRQRYRVTTVLTAGSPVGHVPTPAGVGVLHLEHVADAVPALDAALNPDEAGRTTVWHAGSGPAVPAPAGPGPADGAAWRSPDQHARVAGGGAHDASSYARTAGLVDDSAHPSLVAWRERAAEVLGGAEATATSTVYVATRDDPLLRPIEEPVSGAPRCGDGAG